MGEREGGWIAVGPRRLLRPKSSVGPPPPAHARRTRESLRAADAENVAHGKCGRRGRSGACRTRETRCAADAADAEKEGAVDAEEADAADAARGGRGRQGVQRTQRIWKRLRAGTGYRLRRSGKRDSQFLKRKKDGGLGEQTLHKNVDFSLLQRNLIQC